MIDTRFYVYLLLDPRNHYAPFYVGKEVNRRFREHLRPKADKINARKDAKIANIRAAGLEPVVMFWERDLSSSDAYSLEVSLIQRFGRLNIDPDGILTNICLKAHPPTRSNPRKGKTYEEIFGSTEAAKQMRAKCSQRQWKGHTEEAKAAIKAATLARGVKPPIQKRAGCKVVRSKDGRRYWGHPDDLHKYYLRDGKYYDFDDARGSNRN